MRCFARLISPGERQFVPCWLPPAAPAFDATTPPERRGCVAWQSASTFIPPSRQPVEPQPQDQPSSRMGTCPSHLRAFVAITWSHCPPDPLLWFQLREPLLQLLYQPGWSFLCLVGSPAAGAPLPWGVPGRVASSALRGFALQPSGNSCAQRLVAAAASALTGSRSL